MVVEREAGNHQDLKKTSAPGSAKILRAAFLALATISGRADSEPKSLEMNYDPPGTVTPTYSWPLPESPPPPIPVEVFLVPPMDPVKAREIATGLFVKIEEDLARFHHRPYHRFDAVTSRLGESDRNAFIIAIPELLKSEPTNNFTELLSWCRLYKLYSLLGGTIDWELTSAALKYVKRYLEQGAFTTTVFAKDPNSPTKQEKLEGILEAINYRVKEIFALHEICDDAIRCELNAELEKIEKFVHQLTNKEEFIKYLEHQIRASSQNLKARFEPLTVARVLEFESQTGDTVRARGMQIIAKAFKLDPNFVAAVSAQIETRQQLLESAPQTEIEYATSINNVSMRWAVELSIPKEDDTAPTLVFRDRQAPDRFRVINLGALILRSDLKTIFSHPSFSLTSGNFIAYGPKRRERSRVAEHLKNAVEEYELENNSEIKKSTSDYDLDGYDKIIMLRPVQDTHDHVIAALIIDQFLMSFAYKEKYGADRVEVDPISFTGLPKNELEIKIRDYQKKYPGKRLLFNVSLYAHGNEDMVVLGSQLSAADLLKLQEKYDLNLHIQTCACGQGGLVSNLRKAINQKPELAGKISIAASCAPYGFGLASQKPYGQYFEYIRNPLRAPLYDLGLIQGLLKGKTFGQAHIEADRRVKEMHGAASDAQALFKGLLIGRIDSNNDWPFSGERRII